MKLQFKEQDFQVNGVKAVVDCFQGQPIKTNRFTLERSKELIRKTKMAASGVTQVSAFDDEVLEDIGYRNSSIQVLESQILKNIQQVASFKPYQFAFKISIFWVWALGVCLEEFS